MNRVLIRILLVIIAVVAVLGVGYLLIQGEYRRIDSARIDSVGNPEKTDSIEVQIGGAFELIDQNEHPRKASDFYGSYHMVYFGFSSCPNICPVDLAVMVDAIKFADKQDQIIPIFITVDPERDTPAQLKTYASLFSEDLVALTGSQAAIDQAIQNYRVYSQKVTDDSTSEYQMNHSGYTYLMDKQGRYVSHFSHGQTVEEVASILNKLIR